MRIFYTLLILLCFTGGLAAQPTPGGSMVKFYPNPATSVINFELPKDDGKTSSYQLQIFSFLGKKVLQIDQLSAKTTINLNEFYRGVYIFQLRDRNGKVIESGKFQVSK